MYLPQRYFLLRKSSMYDRTRGNTWMYCMMCKIETVVSGFMYLKITTNIKNIASSYRYEF